jgi:hypothetical protein
MLNVKSKVDWSQYAIGGVVDVTVKEVNEFGVTLTTPNKNVTAFAITQHAANAQVGSKVKKTLFFHLLTFSRIKLEFLMSTMQRMY